MCLKIYYHYTDREGLKGILRTQKIQKSKGGRYGSGVYLTKLHPENGRYRVAMNNWDGGWAAAERGGKTDYAISVKLPSHRVERRCDYDDDTDIYVFDDHIYLPMTTYRLYSQNGTHEEVKLEAEDMRSTRKEMTRMPRSSNALQRCFNRGGPQLRVGYAEEDEYDYTRGEEMQRMRYSPKSLLRDPAFNMGGPRVEVGDRSPEKAGHGRTPRELIQRMMIRNGDSPYAPPTDPFFNTGGPRVEFGYGPRDLFRCGYSH